MMPSDAKPEQPSTYFVADRSNQDELNRIRIQDHMITTSMGGVLPEQPASATFQRVLDIGCGTGSWLIELARTMPAGTVLVGVDASRTYIEFARQQAAAAQVSDRVEFHVADALRMLEFPTDFFDLVNQRLAAGWLRTWEWPKLLQEYQRVTCPGGVVRITEPMWIPESTSPALTRLFELFLQASYHAGHLFTPASDGLINELAPLLQRHGFQQVQTRVSSSRYHAGTPEQQVWAEDMRLLFRTIVPFLRKWIRVPENYEEIYRQMLYEMQQPDFEAEGGLLTAWGMTEAQ
ncbi:MAG TPA: class I SAM-dependent methyltransferase [Ktedonobacteraceae bacterium]|nr:class I SAM-dependent methyltransferase [Ktedonobacteraceae bacterium]